MPKLNLDQRVREEFSDIEDEYDELTERALDSEYWDRSLDFWLDIRDKFVEELSEEQIKWLKQLESSLKKDLHGRP